MKAPRVQIVEDEAVTALDIQDALQDMGYEVSGIAASAIDAIEMANMDHPDLVLMDICLKGPKSGIEAADYIRTHLGIPIVYLTALADDEVLKRAKITEPFAYLLKPFEPRELKMVIEMALYRVRIEGELAISLNNFHNIAKANSDGILVVSEDGIVMFANPAAERIFGRTADELKRRPFELPFVLGASEVDIIRANREHGIGAMRTESTIWNHQEAYLVIITDVTERKFTQATVDKNE